MRYGVGHGVERQKPGQVRCPECGGFTYPKGRAGTMSTCRPERRRLAPAVVGPVEVRDVTADEMVMIRRGAPRFVWRSSSSVLCGGALMSTRDVVVWIPPWVVDALHWWRRQPFIGLVATKDRALDRLLTAGEAGWRAEAAAFLLEAGAGAEL